MSTNINNIINALDSRHEAAQPILRALAAGKKVKAADIDALNSRFVQVAPLLHAINDGKGILQSDIDALDTFAGQRLRLVLGAIGLKAKVRTKAQPSRKVARKK